MLELMTRIVMANSDDRWGDDDGDSDGDSECDDGDEEMMAMMVMVNDRHELIIWHHAYLSIIVEHLLEHALQSLHCHHPLLCIQW